MVEEAYRSVGAIAIVSSKGKEGGAFFLFFGRPVAAKKLGCTVAEGPLQKRFASVRLRLLAVGKCQSDATPSLQQILFFRSSFSVRYCRSFANGKR